MTSLLFLGALAAVLIVTSIVLLFIGVIKKNKSALIASAIVFAIPLVGFLVFLSYFTVTSFEVSQSPAGTSRSTVVSSLDETTKLEESTTSANDEVAVIEKNWTNKLAEIKKISIKNGFTYLSLDLLTINPNFLPGFTGFSINQSAKLREVKVDDNAKFFKCGAGWDDNDTTADVSSSTKELIAYIQKRLAKNDESIYYFDITDGVVKKIYESCLP